MKRPDWGPTVDRLLAEIEHGDARTEAYWAQQLAFGPVLVHAVGLRMRDAHIGSAALVRCVQLALAAFGSLPEPPDADPVGLRTLAMRQARALGWRRRATLRRLLQRLGVASTEEIKMAPARMARSYPLIGFRPDDRLAG